MRFWYGNYRRPTIGPTPKPIRTLAGRKRCFLSEMSTIRRNFANVDKQSLHSNSNRLRARALPCLSQDVQNLRLYITLHLRVENLELNLTPCSCISPDAIASAKEGGPHGVAGRLRQVGPAPGESGPTLPTAETISSESFLPRRPLIQKA